MPVELRVTHADYGALSRALKRSAPTIRKNMRREIGAACRPIVKEARQQILAAESVPSILKVPAAKKVRLVNRDSKNRTFIAIVAPAAGSEFPVAHQRLNKYGRFRHPVYADARKGRDKWKWVNQYGAANWFDGPFIRAQMNVWKAVKTAMDRAFAELSRIR